jgi:dipeptidyl aminopeptidase/acylaminoacyl peptidase
LVLIDVASGNITYPMYTANAAESPDWSPSGDSLVYDRLIRTFDEPIDSIGVHILDVRTGRDHLLAFNDTVFVGIHPRWSPRGDQIVCNASYPSAAPVYGGIFSISPDGSRLRLLSDIPSGGYYDYPQWLARQVTARLDVVFFGEGALQGRTYSVSCDWPGQRLLYGHFHRFDSFSFNGEELVFVHPQPTDSVQVLFIRHTDDILGTSSRQLTHWKARGEAIHDLSEVGRARCPPEPRFR